MKTLSAIALSISLLALTACGQDNQTENQVNKDNTTQNNVQAPGGSNVNNEYPLVKMSTSLGEIEIELYKDKAPKTVANFLTYVQAGFYSNTIFHRVIDNFMIQGGGFNTQLIKKLNNPPVVNEGANGLSNKVGTIAMARTPDPDSATSQFYINVKNNSFLDTQTDASGTVIKNGYTVFGKVTKGMDVVNKIKSQPTYNNGSFANLPKTMVVINSVNVIKQ